MLAIGNALLSSAASSLCALQCDAFDVPMGAANLDLSYKQLGAAAATLLAGLLKGNTTITKNLSPHKLCGEKSPLLSSPTPASQAIARVPRPLPHTKDERW